MQISKGRILLIAGVLGITTAILIHTVLVKQTARKADLKVGIMVANQSIPSGSIIEMSMLKTKQAPKDSVSEDTAQTPEAIVGKVSTRDINMGEPISLTSLATKDRLSQVIPRFMRAVTVAVDPISGVGGFIRTGDRVDVVATFNINSGTLTKTILQNAEVLAIGTETSLPGKKPSQNSPQQPPSATATLSVSPEEAEKLVLADSKGQLRLMLRPSQDTAYVRTKGVAGRAVVGNIPPDIPEPAKTQPSAKVQQKPIADPATFVPPVMQPLQPVPVANMPEPGKKIQVIRGTKIDEVSVPD